MPKEVVHSPLPAVHPSSFAAYPIAGFSMDFLCVGIRARVPGKHAAEATA